MNITPLNKQEFNIKQQSSQFSRMCQKVIDYQLLTQNKLKVTKKGKYDSKYKLNNKAQSQTAF